MFQVTLEAAQYTCFWRGGKAKAKGIDPIDPHEFSGRQK
jgi:hypothetical protein